MSGKNSSGLDRRRFLKRAGLAAGAASVGAASLGAISVKGDQDAGPWTHEADVVCVGSGAAASSAAIAALDRGAEVLMLEKMPFIGGTTLKSGGALWIPNNFVLRKNGVEDKREDCLRYMARYAYPQTYTPNSPTLGLAPLQYRLLEAYYDNASVLIDRLQELEVLQFREFRMYHLDVPVPDYADHLPENKVGTGRCMEPSLGTVGLDMGGASMITQMIAWLRARDVPILTETQVTAVISANNRVIGVEADAKGKTLRVRARRAVVFGTGGYVYNEELIRRHQTALYGSCAAPGSTGDFISIAGAAGAAMGNLGTAWRTEVLFEEAIQSRAIGGGAHFLPGDSMILVNKYGKRVVNEKRSYNDRTNVHFVFDPTREEYPNQLLFMVFDERSLDAYGGNFPFPRDRKDARYLISGKTLDELATDMAARLATIADKSGGVELDEGFAGSLKSTIARYNKFARSGVDKEFDRGLHEYDRVWHLLFSAWREGTSYRENTLPNSIMYPFSRRGPYHAFILAAGALDTSGGPQINESAQVLALDGVPLAGLYGAGNCIASPSVQAYFGGGCTIGLAMTFGYIAGANAARETAG